MENLVTLACIVYDTTLHSSDLTGTLCSPPGCGNPSNFKPLRKSATQVDPPKWKLSRVFEHEIASVKKTIILLKSDLGSPSNLITLLDMLTFLNCDFTSRHLNHAHTHKRHSTDFLIIRLDENDSSSSHDAQIFL